MDQTDADLIKKYVEIRDFIEKKSAAFGEQMKPYSSALQSIEGEMNIRLTERGAQNCKTEFGTAFKKTSMSVRCADRESFLDYVFAHEARDLLTSHVAKDSVKDYLEQSGGQPPPGVDVTYVVQVNIRRS